MKIIDSCTARLGSAATRVALAAGVIGVIGMIVAAATGRSATLFSTIAVDFLFFGGVAAGGVAVSAIVNVAKGHWAAQLLPAAEAGGAFQPVALALAAAAAVGARIWMPWAGAATGGALALLAIRVSGIAAALWITGLRLRTQRTHAAALVYLVTYCIGMSILTFDIAMRLYDGEQSTGEPALYFIGSVVAGLAWSTFVSTFGAGALDSKSRHDAGKLLFALSTFWLYLVWSNFLPLWYANVPSESALLLARWAGAYRAFTLGALFLGAFIPFFILLFESGKRNVVTLRIASLSVVGGIFCECVLLVLPDLPAGGAETAAIVASVSAGCAGVFVLLQGAAMASAPAGAPTLAAASHPPHG